RGLDDHILRSKGILWVAGMESSLIWHQAGSTGGIEAGTRWLHGNVDLLNWPKETPPEYREAPYGDMRQELVFIGRNFNKEALKRRLEQALVTGPEFQLGPDSWSQWPNPFRERVFGHNDQHAHERASSTASWKRRPASTRGRVLGKTARALRKRKRGGS
ncbi:unnamed protein product, partial [Symbiodinium pilosum]